MCAIQSRVELLDEGLGSVPSKYGVGEDSTAKDNERQIPHPKPANLDRNHCTDDPDHHKDQSPRSLG